MNTSAGYYQAPRPPRVPLDEVLIKLHPEGFNQEFEADGINVGTGGLSMRASVLPELGSTLRCQLDNPAGGEAIEMIGRVVWAHESGPHVGEFGIRFTHLSDDDQVRIEALIQRWGRSSATAPTVRLQLDGVGSAIVAEIHSESESGLSVEQPLPFLAIGSTVINETTGRRGHLEDVELKIDDDTPKLVMSIGYELVDATAALADKDQERDTMPDETPPVIRSSHGPSEERSHDTPRIVRYDSAADEVETLGTIDRLKEYTRAAADQLAGSVGSARAAVSEGLIPQTSSKVKDAFALSGRFVGALRSRLDEKPRRQQVPRSEAARAHLKNTRRNGRRYMILAAMVLGIVSAGWGIYVWAASGVESDATTESASATEPASATESATATATELATATATAREPAAAPVPSDFVEQGAPLPPESVRGMTFGAESVANGEKYVLKMSNPVIEMDGIVEEDGFSVAIPGSLSLSRAGPIAAAHPDVEHAGILNRGDFSELTVRFVAGRRPEYRVEARGTDIEITIAR